MVAFSTKPRYICPEALRWLETGRVGNRNRWLAEVSLYPLLNRAGSAAMAPVDIEIEALGKLSKGCAMC